MKVIMALLTYKANKVTGTMLRSLLVFVNANRGIRKHTDTGVAFTQEYFRVSYLYPQGSNG
jgi:hypothetical protein